MTDKSTLSHDELAADIRAGLLEAEARADDGNHIVLLTLLQGAHALLDKAAKRASGQGLIQPMSVGGDKD